MRCRQKIHIHSDYRHLRPLIELIPTGNLPVEHTYCNRRNRVQRVKIGDFEMVVKRFKRPNLINSYVYTHLRPSKAYRSYANALRFLKKGVPTPHPVALIINTECGALTDSWYISLYEPSDPIGATVTEQMRPEMDRLFEQLPMLQQFMDFTVELFRKGIWQRDFNRGNFLARETSSDKWIFPMVDINRVKYGTVTPRMVATSWMRFGADTCPNLVENLTVRVGKALGLPEEECRREACKAVKRGARVERRRQFKRAMRRRLRS